MYFYVSSAFFFGDLFCLFILLHFVLLFSVLCPFLLSPTVFPVGHGLVPSIL